MPATPSSVITMGLGIFTINSNRIIGSSSLMLTLGYGLGGVAEVTTGKLVAGQLWQPSIVIGVHYISGPSASATYTSHISAGQMF